MNTPLVGIVYGSTSDEEVMAACCGVLEDNAIPYEKNVMSAHRTPEKVAEYSKSAKDRGIKVLIAGAGLAAHLAGAVAANSTLPVIGVPLAAGTLGGLDALLSTVQMPPGVPVATVAIGKHGAKNAAWLAMRILALTESEIADKLTAK
jgi:phosphoribosylaminoimidazole carboxylase PurE protein